jgi:hypothetical protein
MLEHNKENDELVLQYRELVKKADNESDPEKKTRYVNQIKEMHKEMLIQEFGDKSFERFTGKF